MGVAFQDIKNPAEGLRLLSGIPPINQTPAGMTPEQHRIRLFWFLMFTFWQQWRDGDTLALPRAVYLCKMQRQPPPQWLVNATTELVNARMSDDERRRHGDFMRCLMRWQAVQTARGLGPGAPRDQEPDISVEKACEQAEEALRGTEAEASAPTIMVSYSAIKRAGGAQASLASYRLTKVGRRAKYRPTKLRKARQR
jgi:hypothetical protein